MSQTTFAIIEAIPQVLQLVVAVLGLIYSIKGRPNGVSGQMVGAFVVLLVTTVLGLVWQFLVINIDSWHLSESAINAVFLGVDVPLGVGSALAWLLVALAVLRSGRGLRQFVPGNYPMGGQPGAMQPGFAQPGYAQPGYQQPGYPQQSQQSQAYPQPGYQQPGYQQPGQPQPGYQPNPGAAGMPPQTPQPPQG